MSSLALRVRQIDRLTPNISRLLLVAADASPLPAFTAGAHLELHVPGERPLRRAYSLVNLTGGDHYEIAVQREAASSGGSHWVHSLQVGDHLHTEPPRNHFPLDDNAEHSLLIAAGIGITPMLGMARALAARGARFSLHYAGRHAEQMAYLEECRAFADSRCWISEGQAHQRFAAAEVLTSPFPGTHLYICGPAAMIYSVLDCARALGWSEQQLHYELFTGTLEQQGDCGFEVYLRDSAMTLQVGPGQSVLDAMIDAGLDPLFDCRRGDCGVCVAKVLEGTPDHRDLCLSERDRAAGSICTCVSRASSPLLVLDL
jgi:vanillate O-demethylase ferredoxin subunit